MSGSCCLYGFVGNEREHSCCFSCIHKPERLKHPWRSEFLLAERRFPAGGRMRLGRDGVWGGMHLGRDALGRDGFRRDAFTNRLTPGLAADAVPGDRRASPGDTGSISIAATRSNSSPWPSPPAGAGGSAKQEPRLVPSLGAGSSRPLEMVHVI